MSAGSNEGQALDKEDQPMQQREVEIVSELGLNASASTRLTELAAKYQCEVSLSRRGRKVNAKSLKLVWTLSRALPPSAVRT